MATTVKFPMELLSVQISSANTFWTAKSGANIDLSHVAFVDSGEGVAFYWGYVPNNLAATPAWNLDIGHYVDSSTGGGGAVLSVFARALSTNPIDVAPIVVSSLATIVSNSSYTYSAVTGANLDAVVAISATNVVIVKILRHGGVAGDTISGTWDLQAVIMRCDIT